MTGAGKVVHNAPEGGFEAHVPLLIVGGGACGLTAALAAHDAGAEVLVLEAEPTCHGSSGMSLGAVCAAGTREQARHGIDDDAAGFFADILAKTHDHADPLLALLAAQRSGAALDWLAERHQVAFELDLGWKPAFGHTARRMHATPGRSGLDMMARLLAACDRADVPIMTSASVDTLYADAQGRILGVRIVRPDGQVEQIGCDALLLATCGFGGDPALIAAHIRTMRDARYFGWEANRGDALRWGEALGASLGDLDAYQGLGLLAEPHGIDVNPKILIEGGIQVNVAGERFSDELGDVSGQGARVIAQPGGVAWVIYDARIHDLCVGLPQYDALLALGAMKVAADVPALAQTIGVPGEALQWTIAATQLGGDRFGRVFAGLPLTAPFHALKVTGALFHTQGGLRVDRDARVLKADGQPFANLFAGGGAARSIGGPGPSGYLPGAGLCMAITLGHVGGAAAGMQVRGAA